MNTEPITEEVRAETVAKLAAAQAAFSSQLELIAVLDRHWITETDNLGYYRSQVHCSCAAEWWAGSHDFDPSYDDMWAIHRAEVVAGFLARHDDLIRAEALKAAAVEIASATESYIGGMGTDGKEYRYVRRVYEHDGHRISSALITRAIELRKAAEQ